LIKKTVDPSSVLTLVFPGSTAELIQQLSHNYISYFDNKSVIKEWVSDQLCRGVTGTGFSKRKLYSDDDDIICQFMRGIGFNGINLAASKADLLDRGIIVELAFIDEKHRRLIKEIWTEFERIRPQLLGYIFDVVARVLWVKNNGGIQLKTRSRMADFEEYAEIISRCMGNKEGAFLEAYHENKQVQTDTALEGKPVARAIIHFMQLRENEAWNGTATELLGELEPSAINLKINLQREKLWPKAPHILSRRITEVKTNLSQVGIRIDETKDPKTRLKMIHIRAVASEASEALETSKSWSNEAKFSDANANATLVDYQVVASENKPQDCAQNEGSDATNATNATTLVVPPEISNSHSLAPVSVPITDTQSNLDLEEPPPKPRIYQIRTGWFGCDSCKMTGDKWFMPYHNCSEWKRRKGREKSSQQQKSSNKRSKN
jgi:hypothetical protein